jgi:hypothetical protein
VFSSSGLISIAAYEGNNSRPTSGNTGTGATATIQLEIESDSFVGEDILIGMMVNTKGERPR